MTQVPLYVFAPWPVFDSLECGDPTGVSVSYERGTPVGGKNNGVQVKVNTGKTKTLASQELSSVGTKLSGHVKTQGYEDAVGRFT